jgi:hypothetical protein
MNPVYNAITGEELGKILKDKCCEAIDKCGWLKPHLVYHTVSAKLVLTIGSSTSLSKHVEGQVLLEDKVILDPTKPPDKKFEIKVEEDLDQDTPPDLVRAEHGLEIRQPKIKDRGEVVEEPMTKEEVSSVLFRKEVKK